MTVQAPDGDFTWSQQAGLYCFIFLCGVPALEMNGFGVGIPITYPVALGIATVGGVVGGALMCPNPLLAGLIGGLLAGPLGLAAVHYYTEQRTSVHTFELVLVQGIASLPGVGVGYLLYQLLGTPAKPSQEGQRPRRGEGDAPLEEPGFRAGRGENHAGRFSREEEGKR